MRNRLLVAGATCVLAVVLAACSSSAATPSTGGGGGGGGGPTATPVSSSGSAPASQPPASGGGGGTKPVPDPCSLLTQPQVAGVVGVAVGPGEEESHTCSFTYNDPAKVLDQVAASVSDNIQVTQITKDCQASSVVLKVTPVSGVGDVACFVDGGSLGAHIAFASGGLGFEVSVLAFGSLQPRYSTATAEGMEQALALDVIATL